jgi:hypothetical protein
MTNQNSICRQKKKAPDPQNRSKIDFQRPKTPSKRIFCLIFRLQKRAFLISNLRMFAQKNAEKRRKTVFRGRFFPRFYSKKSAGNRKNGHRRQLAHQFFDFPDLDGLVAIFVGHCCDYRAIPGHMGAISAILGQFLGFFGGF